LTGENKLVTDRPFTTLSSKYQKRYIDPNTTVLFIDTIGFVLDLDHRLIKSFQINFEDIRSADLVILLFEVTDDPITLRLKMNEGLSLLRDIGVNLRRVLFVFNKVDLSPNASELIPQQLKLEQYDIPWTFVSAKKRINLNGLLGLISTRLKEIKETPEVALKPIEIQELIINNVVPSQSDHEVSEVDQNEDEKN
jgi:GTP-binding protein HflX